MSAGAVAELLKFPTQEFARKEKKKKNPNCEIMTRQEGKRQVVAVGVVQSVNNAVLRKQLVSEGAFDSLRSFDFISIC